MKKTIGGDRIGSGAKMQVDLHGYARSSHDLGYLWRSSMSCGTLVPFLRNIGLPGDSFDIDLDIDVKTLPTIGPLFGSYKVQLDVFTCPIRLYQGALHNNKLGIGLKMSDIKLPQLAFKVDPLADGIDPANLDNSQINPSSVLAYLGIRGLGMNTTAEPQVRYKNGLYLLGLWDIYKNYYANKQEDVGAVIHTPIDPPNETIDTVDVNGTVLPQLPATGTAPFGNGQIITINYTGAYPKANAIVLRLDDGAGGFIEKQIKDVAVFTGSTPSTITYVVNTGNDQIALAWRYFGATDMQNDKIEVATFPLSNIDDMRDLILAQAGSTSIFEVNATGLTPYIWAAYNGTPGVGNSMMSSQEGLPVKTYQSDLLNNWIQTEWIDGPNGINEITAISTAGDQFTIDQLQLSKKVYDMMNRIAISGGSYKDWLDAVYTHTSFWIVESPVYEGGLIKELVFQEVVSNAAAESENSETGEEPLGTLAGKGVLSKKHKGGSLKIKINEPSILIGLCSLTPRIDYSQGNDWSGDLLTMDDLHKPALDEIGFQESLNEQRAWWSTGYDEVTDTWIQTSAGKVPAWLNYMTDINRTYGNFAIEGKEMYMTLNRKYEGEPGTHAADIVDLTTYIDPVKYNQIFAQTELDAQNFWVQIAVDMTARRKMSAKLMPNL